MELIYKKMEEKEIEDVLLLFRKLREDMTEVSFADVDSKEVLTQWVQDSSYIVCIVKNAHNVIGVFRGIRGRGNESHSAVLTLAIHPHYRGLRLGKKLTEYGLKKLKEEGITIARAYVYSNNRPSINTLLTCGFTISGCIYWDHLDTSTGEYVDDIIFHKLL